MGAIFRFFARVPVLKRIESKKISAHKSILATSYFRRSPILKALKQACYPNS